MLVGVLVDLMSFTTPMSFVLDDFVTLFLYIFTTTTSLNIRGACHVVCCT